MFEIFFSLVSFVISVLFPLYASFKALDGNDSSILKPWLTYWVIYAAFVSVESFLGVFTTLIPFYLLVRLYFLLWLILPQTKGSVFLYNAYFAPFLKTHEKSIETFVNNIHNNMWVFLADIKQYIVDTVKAKLFGIKRDPQEQKPAAGYFDSFKNYYFSAGESSLGENASLSNSYVDSLLSQFKEQKSDVQFDASAVTFIKSFLSTIPQSGLTLRGEFDNNDTSKKNSPSEATTTGFFSSRATDDSDEFDEVADDLAADGNNSWINIKKDKSE